MGKDGEEGKMLYTAYLIPSKEELATEYGEKDEKILYRILDGGKAWVTTGVPIFKSMD